MKSCFGYLGTEGANALQSGTKQDKGIGKVNTMPLRINQMSIIRSHKEIN